MMVNHDQFEQNGSKVVSIVYDLLHMVLAEFKKLPRKLHINLDNCWRYNHVINNIEMKSILGFNEKEKWSKNVRFLLR